MRTLVSIDNSKLKYSPHESIKAMCEVMDEVIVSSDTLFATSLPSEVLAGVIMHMFVENYRESNIFREEVFEDKKPPMMTKEYLLKMNTFINDFGTNKVNQEYKERFDELKEFIQLYVEAYKWTLPYFKKHLLTMPMKVDELIMIYNHMIKL